MNIYITPHHVCIMYRLFVIWPLFGQLWNLSKNSLLLISSTWCWNFWSWVHVFPCSFVMFFLHVHIHLPYKQCHSPWNNRKRYVRNEKYDQLQDFLHEKLPQTTTDTQLPPFVICGSKKHTTSAAGVWRNIYSLRQLHVPDQVQSCLQEMERFKTKNLDSKAYDMLYVYIHPEYVWILTCQKRINTHLHQTTPQISHKYPQIHQKKGLRLIIRGLVIYLSPSTPVSLASQQKKMTCLLSASGGWAQDHRS